MRIIWQLITKKPLRICVLDCLTKMYQLNRYVHDCDWWTVIFINRYPVHWINGELVTCKLA